MLEVGIDGNAGFALAGENLQEGEAEFAEVVQAPGQSLMLAQAEACGHAVEKLLGRIGIARDR